MHFKALACGVWLAASGGVPNASSARYIADDSRDSELSRLRRRVQQLAGGNHTLSLRHGGRTRQYIAHIPPAAASGRALPLLLAFHGGGGEAAGFQDYAGLDVVADREGFIVVYPYGSGVLPRRLLTWNAGGCCGYAMDRKVDDVGFAIAVLDDVARRANVDRGRVYATGHSNGAMMTYRLGAERADRIAAIAPVAGAYNVAAFAPSRPVAVLHVHSVDDPRALYDGGLGPPFPGTNVRSPHRPVMEGIERWRVANKCSAAPRSAESRAGTAKGSGAAQTATMLVWDGCAGGTKLAHWKLTGVGHGWPGNATAELREGIIGPSTTLISAAEEVWKFVSGVRR
jgi:polyhydroxybutyrate depolymerase